MIDKCTVCGTTTKPVQIYKIYYGKKGASATANSAYDRQTTTKYSINPEPLTISICNSCVYKERTSKTFLGIFLIGLGLFLGWLFYTAPGLDITGTILMLCALLFFGGTGYFKYLVVKDPEREKIAMNIAKKQLSQSEFNAFFTEAKYKSLNILPEFSQKTTNNEADEISNLLRIIEIYGSSEVHYIDGSANKALIAAQRLAIIGKNEPWALVALSNILTKLRSQRRTFRNPLAELDADNLISVVFDIVTKNAMKPSSTTESKNSTTFTIDEKNKQYTTSEAKKQSSGGLRFPTKPIDWETKITENFRVEVPISFADEEEIIADLETANLESLSDNMKWNLSLCLAYGSDQLAKATAKAIFKIIQKRDSIEPFRWMSNVMLNTGDAPSGINWTGGLNGLKILLENCPPKYRNELHDLIVDNTNYDIDYSYNPNQDDSDNVVFLQETRKNNPLGIISDGLAIATYKVYRGDSKKAAYDFLTKNNVTEKMIFLVVETPDGNFCRDINGIYKER